MCRVRNCRSCAALFIICHACFSASYGYVAVFDHHTVVLLAQEPPDYDAGFLKNTVMLLHGLAVRAALRYVHAAFLLSLHPHPLGEGIYKSVKLVSILAGEVSVQTIDFCLLTGKNGASFVQFLHNRGKTIVRRLDVEIQYQHCHNAAEGTYQFVLC